MTSLRKWTGCWQCLVSWSRTIFPEDNIVIDITQECTALTNLSPHLKAKDNFMLYMWTENVWVKVNLSTRYKFVL